MLKFINLLIQLYPTWPNPFNANINIQLLNPVSGDLTLNIYDTSGKKQSSNQRNLAGQGPHMLRWNGCNENGEALSSGVYVLHVRSQLGQVS